LLPLGEELKIRIYERKEPKTIINVASTFYNEKLTELGENVRREARGQERTKAEWEAERTGKQQEKAEREARKKERRGMGRKEKREAGKQDKEKSWQQRKGKKREENRERKLKGKKREQGSRKRRSEKQEKRKKGELTFSPNPNALSSRVLQISGRAEQERLAVKRTKKE